MSQLVAYIAVNTVTGGTYVGITSRALSKRWKDHLSSARRGIETAFYRALRAHGPEAFAVEIVACALDYASLKALERALIAQHYSHVSNGGYNVTRGGDGALGRAVSSETRRKHSENTRKAMRDPERRNALSRMASQQWASPRFRAEQSERRKGRRASAESRAKMSASKKGVVRSPEWQERISAALRGKKRPKRVVELLRQHALNRAPMSADARAKLSAAHKGIPKSEAHRAAIADGLRRRRMRAAIELATDELVPIEYRQLDAPWDSEQRP